MNHEIPDVQAGFRKGRGTRDQIAHICWIIEKAREFQKNIYFCFIKYVKAFDCVSSVQFSSVQSLSCVRLFATPMDCSPPGSLTMGFPRQEYLSGLTFPSPGDLANPGIKPSSPALAGKFFTTDLSGRPTVR